MNDTVIKSKKISRKEMGFALPSMNISPEYYKRQAEQRARWAKEDAERAKKA